ncbi:MAG: hypothetical protein AB1758_25490, partial [Candidatus Eremiobacterota bacterium]
MGTIRVGVDSHIRSNPIYTVNPKLREQTAGLRPGDMFLADPDQHQTMESSPSALHCWPGRMTVRATN